MVTSDSLLSELQARIMRGVWKPGQPIPTGQELADEFGISVSTVKKAIHQLHKDGLVWGRRGKGRFVADNPLPGRTWTIGVVLYDMEHLHHPLHSQRLAGAQAALRETPYHLAVFAVSSHAGRRQEGASGYRWLGFLDPRTVDGVIVLSRQITPTQIEELAKVVAVCTDRAPLAYVGACVRDDVTAGAFQATRHLLELGHRRLALLTVGEADHIGYAQREGFRLAARTLGFKDVTQQIHTGQGFTVAEGARCARELLAAPTRPTAILCGADELATGAYRELTQAGLKVPADVSLVGWNDSITDGIPLAMTTLRLQAFEFGRQSVQHLVALIEHPETRPEPVTLPPELIVRASTCPPPA